MLALPLLRGSALNRRRPFSTPSNEGRAGPAACYVFCVRATVADVSWLEYQRTALTQSTVQEAAVRLIVSHPSLKKAYEQNSAAVLQWANEEQSLCPKRAQTVPNFPLTMIAR